MVMLLLVMINLLIEKAKKIIENKRITDDDASSVTASRLDPKVFDDVELKETIYDIIKTIKDPEKPATLEELNVIQEDDIYILQPIEANGTKIVRIEFTPTVPHCSLATLIGLCIRVKLQRTLLQKVKVDIFLKEGSHSTENEINKQVNDKERVAAAMENPNLFKIVEKCIEEIE